MNHVALEEESRIEYNAYPKMKKKNSYTNQIKSSSFKFIEETLHMILSSFHGNSDFKFLGQSKDPPNMLFLSVDDSSLQRSVIHDTRSIKN